MKDKFWCPRGHFNEDQFELFQKLARDTNPKFVLETGFCTGRSAYSVLKNSEIKKMISIDINFDYMKPEGKIFRKLFVENFPNFSAIEASSREILTKDFMDIEFPEGLDWVTIDGDHSFEGCMSDLNSVCDHMNKGGLIVVDDYKKQLPNVIKACDSFNKQHPEFKKELWKKENKGVCIFRKT